MKPQVEVDFFDGFVDAHRDNDVLGYGTCRRLLDEFESVCKPCRGEVCLDCGTVRVLSLAASCDLI